MMSRRTTALLLSVVGFPSPTERTLARTTAQVRIVPPMTADSRPPELDYAFLASWAGIQADGTLTAVGMSFLRVRQVATTPMAVAGRIRLFKDSEPAPLAIRIASPSGPAVEIVDEVAQSEDEATRYGDDRQQLLFVLNTHVQTAQLGKYDVQISLNDQVVRTLSFEVVAPPTS